MEVLNQLLVKKNKPKTLYLFIHNTTGSELHEIEKAKKPFLTLTGLAYKINRE